jgi:hypothetical protein
VQALEENAARLQREYTENYIALVRAQTENTALRRELEAVAALIRESPVLSGLLGVFAQTSAASYVFAQNLRSVAIAAAAATYPQQQQQQQSQAVGARAFVV